MVRFRRMEVYNAICHRLGDTLHIPEDSVQTIFNDMKLYPSNSEVSTMIQCARQCSRRNGAAPPHLTVGELYVFVREMQKMKSPKQHRKRSITKISNKHTNSSYEVFLGGSCNPTTWREDIAIPELTKHQISFYNPQVATWKPELVALEYDAKQAASVLLFVIDSQTRSTVGMIEVAYLVASGRCVVVVAQKYKQGQSIMDENITDSEYLDLEDGQKSLLYLVKSRGVKIQTSLPSALQCIVSLLRNSSTSGQSPEEQLSNKLRVLREVYDSHGGEEMSIRNLLQAYEKLTSRSFILPKSNSTATQQPVNNATTNGVADHMVNSTTITFDRFCALMAEYSTDGCDTCAQDEVWASQPFHRNNQSSQPTLNNNHTTSQITNITTSQPTSQTTLNPSKLILNPSKPIYQVYLGGSLASNHRWRKDCAIPFLKSNGVTYYNPAMREREIEEEDENFEEIQEGDVLEWKKAMDRSEVLLFVITDDTRSMTTMVLAAHYIGLARNIVLCVQHLPQEECKIGNETLSKNAIKDYNRARVYISDLAKRNQVPLFDDVSAAVRRAAELCTKSTPS